MSAEEITLSIDDLVLEGIDTRERAVFAAALSGELERLISEGGVPEYVLRGALVRAPPLTNIPGETAGAMGIRAAQSIYQGFGAKGAGGDPKPQMSSQGVERSVGKRGGEK